MSVHSPRKVRELPPWNDDWEEPEHPRVYVDEFTSTDTEVTAQFNHDRRSADWFATWINSKDAWTAFGNWLDRYR